MHMPDLRLIASYHAARSFANHLFCNQLAQIGATKPSSLSHSLLPPVSLPSTLPIAVKNEAYPIALTVDSSCAAPPLSSPPFLAVFKSCRSLSPHLTGQVKNVHPSHGMQLEQYAGPQCTTTASLRAHS